jgi:hypothetical protein
MARTGLPAEWLEEMPYSIISADEFETAAGIINLTGIHPFISNKVQDPARRHWGYSAYYNDRYSDEVRNPAPLFADEYDAMFAGLVAITPQP